MARLGRNFWLRAIVGVGICGTVICSAVAGVFWWRVLVTVIFVISVWELLRLRAWWATIFVAVSYIALLSLYSACGVWPTLWFVFIIWANDVGAYLVGSTIGRHRLCPRISPLKTWEGFFGGLVAGVGVGLFCGGDIFWLGLAVVAVVAGVAGDLAESYIKRRAGVKDSGNLLPGHGGMLDRFDALLMAAPFVFAYFLIFG